MDPNDIRNRFTFHPGTDKTIPVHAEARALCHNLAEALNELIPEGREKALAMTSLEQVMFWANAAIARQPEA